MQVEQFLENSARLYPDKVALVHGNERLTYREIDREANRLAHALIEAGVKRGDRVVTFVPNSVEAVLSIFATLKAGAVFVVLNATTKPDKLIYILNNWTFQLLAYESTSHTSPDPHSVTKQKGV